MNNKIIINLLLIYTFLIGISWSQPSPKEVGLPREDVKTVHYDDNIDHTLTTSIQRSIDDFTVTNLLLASDIEGSIHALNRETGELIWTIPGQKSLVQVSALKKIDNVSPDDDLTWIVEPYNEGSLYFFNKEFGLQKFSTSIKDLVLQSPFALNGDDKIYTGVRKTSLYKVDAKTGEIMGSFGLPHGDVDDLLHNISVDDDIEITNDDPSIILIGKTVYELTIYSRNNSLWNVTYTSWGPNNLHSDLILQNQNSLDGVYIAPFHDSSLLAIDSNSKMAKWISNLPSVLINVFDIFKDSQSSNFMLLPHPLHPKIDLTKKELPQETFIDKNKNGSWFAMSDLNYPSLVRSAPVLKYCSNKNLRDSSIFINDELFHKAVSGVHKNFAGQNSLQLANNLIPSMISNKPTQELSKSWLSLPTADILSIDPPISGHYSIKRIILRIFENTITTVLFTLLIVSLSRMGIIPPITQVLSSLGFFKRTNHAVELVDQLLKNDNNLEKSINLIKRERLNLENKDLQNKIDDILENNKMTKKVTILEPEDDTVEKIIPPPLKKARKRGTRGGKKNKKNKDTHIDSPDESEPATAVVTAAPKNNLVLSDVVLGYGSHGTVVYKGTFENRPVLIKRMLIDFYDVASHEVNLLQESDDHPNVIRYYCSQENDRFLYIALELCSATLEDVLDKPDQYEELRSRMNHVDVLMQMINGLHHLHNLKIVHRDIKPQNILCVPPKSVKKDNSESQIRILISDFGLCKKLEADQSSFRATTAHAAGTSGWRAPELLIDENDSINNFVSSDDVQSISEPLVYDDISNRRLTRAIDIFSMGCVFYYVLTNGQHPFGDRYLREGNIIKGQYQLDLLDILPNPCESKDLIMKMISRDPNLRPDTITILKHPFFWSAEKKIDFLLKVSDRFDIERRDPPSELLLKLESLLPSIVGKKGWYLKFEQEFIDDLGKYRKYDTFKVTDLLRAMRNKYHHFNEMKESLLKKMSPLNDGFYNYYLTKFPNLVMEIYYIIELELKDEDVFIAFF